MLTRLNSLTKLLSDVLLICFSLASINIFAQQVLKPQDAFPVEVAYQNNVIQISHQIKDGYYLYKDKISYICYSFKFIQNYSASKTNSKTN